MDEKEQVQEEKQEEMIQEINEEKDEVFEDIADDNASKEKVVAHVETMTTKVTKADQAIQKKVECQDACVATDVKETQHIQTQTDEISAKDKLRDFLEHIEELDVEDLSEI